MSNLILIGPVKPLYSYGGPTRSISNLFELFDSKRVSVIVISPKKNLDRTKNRKLLSHKNIFYNDSFLSGFKKIKSRDVIWLNSVFDYKTMFYLILLYKQNNKLIISPRGELSTNAINTSKPFLKKIYLTIFKFFSKKAIFHVTSIMEFDETSSFFPKNQTKLLPNLVQSSFIKNQNYSKSFVFFSRIHKKKGLYELLLLIKKSQISIKLDIYGFIEDTSYWKKCEDLIDTIDGIRYLGSINNGDFSILKDKYTFFLFPTLNENFGHVILEALSLGLIPLLTKNTTPFEELTSKYFNLNFDLNHSSFLNVIEKALSMSIDELDNLKGNTKLFFNDFKLNQANHEKEYINFAGWDESGRA